MDGGFPVSVKVSDLPVGKEHPDRPFEVPEGLGVHATTRSSVPKILSEGLKPRGETQCQIWPEERVPEWLISKRGERFRNKVLQCREKGVYFWDDYRAGVEQALATVGFIKKDEPVMLVVNTKGLKLKIDPEIEAEPETEAVATFHPGSIPPDRIECICELKEELRPTTGNLMCRTMHDVKECELGQDFEVIYELLSEPDNWECGCRNSLI
jgi:hypothetical protein